MMLTKFCLIYNLLFTLTCFLNIYRASWAGKQKSIHCKPSSTIDLQIGHDHRPFSYEWCDVRHLI